MVNTGDVVLKDMKIEGNLYLTEGIGEGDVTLDAVEIVGELNIKGGGENSIKIKNSKINKLSVDKGGHSTGPSTSSGSTSTGSGSSGSSNDRVEPKTYLLSFEVNDGLAPIENAKINIDGRTITTDENGRAGIHLKDGSYSYSLAADGYKNQVNSKVQVSGRSQLVKIALEAEN